MLMDITLPLAVGSIVLAVFTGLAVTELTLASPQSGNRDKRDG